MSGFYGGIKLSLKIETTAAGHAPPIDPPPSARSTCPVMKAASSDSTNATAAEISRGVPNRRIGIACR